jgi:tyrosine-protein phosphatase SIW14
MLCASNLEMKQKFLHAFLILAASLAWPLVSHAQAKAQTPPPASMRSAYGAKLHISGIPNAGKINDSLYRGAQPREQGLPELKKLGITTIVDLRSEDPQKAEWERKQAEALGMRFVHIPVSGWDAPTNEQVAQFLSLFGNDPSQKIFVHCRFGEDRTGIFIATYRMATEKLPPDQALKEMYSFGFNGLWHPAMKAFVRDFPARLNSAPALAPFHDSASPLPSVKAN